MESKFFRAKKTWGKTWDWKDGPLQTIFLTEYFPPELAGSASFNMYLECMFLNPHYE